MFVITVTNDWEIEQMNVKTVFLYENINVLNIYIKFLYQNEKVCLFKKTLYDLKQASKIWYKTLFKKLKNLEFSWNTYNYEVYKKKNMWVLIYVNDLLIMSLNKRLINIIKLQLSETFHMTDLGLCSFFLNMKVMQDWQ